MVVVPPGSFTMGSPADERGRRKEEGPQRPVTIRRPFAVGKYEVTRGEFARFVNATGHRTGNACITFVGTQWKARDGLNWRNPGFAQTDRHPVVCVTWYDAKAYVRWLSKRTGKRYRLLTEAEWEYVARSGKTSPRYWGRDASMQCHYANGADSAVKARYANWIFTLVPCRDGFVHTAPVGRYRANGFGLHDLHGNAFEWVEDCWHDSYHGAPSDGRSWTERGNCRIRVVRGGSWSSSPSDLRAASRDAQRSGDRAGRVDRDSEGGFRVARSFSR